MKIYFITLLFFSFSFSSFFDDFTKIEPNNNNNQKIMKSLNQTENNIKIYKNIINNILIGCILTSAGVSYLLYNSINNPYVSIELGYNNHNESLEEINDSLKIGFVLNIIITCILIYILYKYNMTQENIEQEIQKITLEDLIL